MHVPAPPPGAVFTQVALRDRRAARVHRDTNPRSDSLVRMSLPDIVPHTEAHPLADGEVRLLGAAHQVTGATTRVVIGGQRVLVDCGVAQGHGHVPFPELARATSMPSC